MEGVVEDAISRPIDRADQLGGAFDRIHQVAFEAVERLDRQFDGAVAHISHRCAMALDDIVEFLFGGRQIAEHAERLIERAAQHFSAGGRDAIDHPLDMVEAGRADLGVGTGDVALGARKHADRRHSEADVGELRAEPLIGFRRAGKDRKFDAVVTETLEVLAQMQVVLADERGPQQHVDSEQHPALPRSFVVIALGNSSFSATAIEICHFSNGRAPKSPERREKFNRVNGA